MQGSHKTRRWFSAWRAKPGRDLDDAADMGTAFGLDFSMDPVRQEPADADTARKSTRSGWLSRLVFRRKSAY